MVPRYRFDELFDADSDYDNFPEVSFFLSHAKVRRQFETMGYDGYYGLDGFLVAAVLWNPALIKVRAVKPVA